MARRDRLRITPGATPGERRSPCLSNRGSLYVGRPARPLPAGLILVMAAAAGKRVCAFAPITPTDWHLLGRGRPDPPHSRGWWPQLTAAAEGGRGAAATAVAVASAGGCGGRTQQQQQQQQQRTGPGVRRGRGEGRAGMQQTALAATSAPGGGSGGGGQTEPAPKTATTNSRAATTPRGVSKERGSGEPNGNDQPRSVVSKPAGMGGGSMPGARERRAPTAVFNGVRRSFRKGGVGGRAGGARGAGGGGRYVGTGGKGEGKTLAELVMFDEIKMQESAPAATSNKTELSQKVEAELFVEYDAMVPGPASSAVGAVGAGGGGEGGGNERTGRPLAINLDLLSYHARQKNLKGDYAESRRLYRSCVELDPRDGRGWLGLARHMQKIHKYNKAQRLFEAGLENCADNPYLLQAFAVMEEGRGNQAKALTLLNRSVRMHPGHIASWVALGLLNERNKRIDEARGCFQTATKNDPRNHYAWLVWGMLEKRFGSLAQAREKFKTCLRVNPRNAKVYQAWGVLEAEEENHALAAELFRAGLEQRPDNTFIMQAWAMMEAKRGDTPQAISLLKKAIITRPRDGAVWQSYALLMKEMGDIAGARALFKKGSEQAPRHCPTWQAWGMMEWQLGRPAEARRLFQEGVWENPKGALVVRILQAWAILEATEGNFDDARKYFGFALARDPFSLPVMVAWALMEESLGDIGRTRQLLEIAVATQAGNPEVWNVYEQVEARAGFTAEAKAVYERGVLAMMTKENEAPQKDRGPATVVDPSATRGSSLLDEASRSLSTSSAEMALQVSRIIGGVQWASDYMSFSALNSSRARDVALEP